jgi:lysophospholipase L1-like esterase
MEACSAKACQGARTIGTGFCRMVWRVALVAVMGISILPSAGEAGSRCKAPQELVRFKAPLNQLARAVATEGEIKIVALGSSSTAGAGAGNPSACYPARLKVELNNRYPGKHFEVINLGVGGHLASDMLARVESEVLTHKPALVIWQTGVNDAIRNVGVDSFRSTLRRGVDELIQHGIDVILLDMQFYPRAEQLPAYRDYLTVMSEVGKEKKVPVLHRFQIMKYWVASLQFSPDQLLAPDHFHPNDLTYGCLADLLADSIQDGLGRNHVTTPAPSSR